MCLALIQHIFITSDWHTTNYCAKRTSHKSPFIEMKHAEIEKVERKEQRKRRQVRFLCQGLMPANQVRTLSIRKNIYIYQVSTKYHFCSRCHAASWKQIISYFMSKFYNLRKVCARKAHNFNSKRNWEIYERERANINLTWNDHFILFYIYSMKHLHILLQLAVTVSHWYL